MGIDLNNKEERNYQAFINELEQISKKYGIGISGCGIFKWQDEEGFKDIKYTNDSSSGDLWIKKLVFSDGEEVNL